MNRVARHTVMITFACVILQLTAHAQPRGFLWDRQTRSYQVARTVVTTVAPKAKFVTSHTLIWEMGSGSVPGHWRGQRANEIKDRAKLTASHLYRITSLGYPVYNGTKVIRLNGITENTTLLSRPNDRNPGLSGQPGRTNVYYARAMHLGIATLAPKQDHVLVVDSLYLPPAMPFVNSFLEMDHDGKPFFKIVAGTIIYESPMLMNIYGKFPGEFVFSCDSLYFNSVYDNLLPAELKPPPPPVFVPQGLGLNVFRNYNGDLENNLLNRLYVKLMESCLNNLRTTDDDWEIDYLVEQFQDYRFNKIKPNNLVQDPATQTKLGQLVASFADDNRENYAARKIRNLDSSVIVVDGDLQARPIRHLKYFSLPTIARVQPLLQDTTIGSMYYTGTGENDLQLSLETELTCDSAAIAPIAFKLAAKGLMLQSKLLENILTIPAQPLKIGGRTVGKIVPLSNKMLRLEMMVTEGSKTIAEWFPKNGNAVFNIDVTAGKDGPTVSQPLKLVVDTALLSRLDYTNPLQRFHVIEKNALTSDLKISSNLSAAREKEGALNYVEVLLQMQFADKSVLYGPYRFSSYSTIGSEMILPFVKYSEPFKTVVSGRAVYDNGEIDITPFETASGVVVLDDAILNKP